MLERRLSEIQLLKKVYGQAVKHDATAEWVVIEDFRLPIGWNRDATELLIVIPPGYPATAPDNFFVPVGFRLSGGGAVSNYSEPVTHLGRQWGQFSFHIDGEWRPAGDAVVGDNLQTFLLKVQGRLQEVN